MVTARCGVALAVVVGALLAGMLPILFGAPTGSSAMAAMVLALWVCALSARGVCCLPLAEHRRPSGHSRGGASISALGSATDPVHSPLRPRAPGLA